MLGGANNKHTISYNLSSGVHLLVDVNPTFLRTQVNSEAFVRGLLEAQCIDN